MPPFAKQARLRKRSDFQRVKIQSRRLHSKGFLVMVSYRNDGGPTRLGVTVSSQVGVAVRRVRVKRLIREVFRLNQGSFPPAADVVVVAKPGCQVDSYQEAVSELLGALQKA